MSFLLITFDFNAVCKCGGNSGVLFGITVPDLQSLKIRSFVILPQSTTKEKTPNPETKENESDGRCIRLENQVDIMNPF